MRATRVALADLFKVHVFAKTKMDWNMRVLSSHVAKEDILILYFLYLIFC